MIVDLDKFDWDTYRSRFITGVVSGGFDPLHTGHIEYMQLARDFLYKASQNAFGDFGFSRLIVVVNGDSFILRKREVQGLPLKVQQTLENRLKIIDALRMVDIVCGYEALVDTVTEPLVTIRPTFFLKGGDRTSSINIPEWEPCVKNQIRIVTGMGHKIDSSSDIIRNAIEDSDS